MHDADPAPLVRSRPDATGRTVAGRVAGPADGTPVLFVAGAATGSSMHLGAAALDAAGVRLLCVDRAGMGASEADPARTVASTADDYRRFAAAVLGVDDPALPVVAHSQGAPFGLRIAADGWATSLTLVSPADEIAHPAVHDSVPADAAALADLVRDDPDAAHRLLRGFDPDRMEQLVLDGADERDRAVYGAPAFRARYRAALAEGFAREGAGYVQDTLLALAAWPVDLAAIRCPVTVLIGAEDRVHSPDLGATLAARVPTAARRVLPGEGGSLLWTRPDLVLAAALGTTAPGPAAPVLRPARPEDADALTGVWRRAVEATHHFLTPGDVRTLEVAVHDTYLPAVDVTVAELDRRPVGFVGTAGHRIEMLFVDPDVHGRGIGRALLAHAARGHVVVDVDVNEQNPGALGFYRAQGFVVTGRSDTDGEGRPFPLLHLRRTGA